MALPVEIAARLAHPGVIEKNFLNYLKKAKCEINNSKTIASQELFHQQSITGLNAIEFFQGSTLQSTTNISGGFKRPASEHFVITEIRVYFGEQTTAWTDANINLRTFNYGSLQLGFTNQNAIDNATLSISTNGVNMLKKLPLTLFDATISNDNIATFKLDQPIIWQGQTELTATLSTKVAGGFGSAGATAFQAARIELRGIGLI